MSEPSGKKITRFSVANVNSPKKSGESCDSGEDEPLIFGGKNKCRLGENPIDMSLVHDQERTPEKVQKRLVCGNEITPPSMPTVLNDHGDDCGAISTSLDLNDDVKRPNFLPDNLAVPIETPTYTIDPGTLYLKSLRHYITGEALPKEDNYRNILSFNGSERKYSRPTLDELQKMEHVKPKESVEGNKLEEGDSQKKQIPNEKVLKFGWIQGVFIRCLLNIWGVMLFLRLSWVVGQCGIFQGLLIITLCNIVTVVTTISMSAVSTNGIIKGGGVYYMISRSLGPEFGGAIGIMFTIANSIAVATYLIGFCDSLLDMIFEYNSVFTGFLGTADNRINDVRLFGAIALVLILVLAVVGMKWVTRVQIILLALLIASQADFLIGSFFPAESEKKFGFVGYSSEVISKNFFPSNYHSANKEDPAPGFFDVFGVFFPAVTGIVAGANLSGDLKDPGTAIPKGTLSAIALTYTTYITYAVIVGSCYLSEASGIEQEYLAFRNQNNTMPYFNNCTNRICGYGSSNDQQTFSKISYTGYLVYAGCFAATLSSAIASLVGAPRVLQALAKDKLYPFIGIFAEGNGSNNDPLRGYFFVFIIAFGCTMIGNLDLVSKLLSNFFVAAYALINFSVLHSSILKFPGWRPSFKYYNKWVSLIGTVLCVAVMLLIDWIAAIITFFSISILYIFIRYRKPDANWGSTTHAQQFLNTLQSLHALSEVPEHVKTYRPKILVFSGIPCDRNSLVEFAYLFTKKLSLLICAHVNQDTSISKSSMIKMKKSAEDWLKEKDMKSFFYGISSNTLDEGAINIMNLCGIGKLSPNMILLGYKHDWHLDTKGRDEYLNIIRNGFDLQLAVGILKLPSPSTDMFKRKSAKKRGFIDVWWLYDDGGLTLLLPYILTTRSQFSSCRLRVFVLANRKEELDVETRSMAALLLKFRIDYANVTVISDVTKPANVKTKEEYFHMLNKSEVDPDIVAHKDRINRHLRLAEALREHSTDSELVVMTLPMPRKGGAPSELFMSWLEMMTRNMPPFLLVRGNQTSVLTFYS